MDIKSLPIKYRKLLELYGPYQKRMVFNHWINNCDEIIIKFLINEGYNFTETCTYPVSDIIQLGFIPTLEFFREVTKMITDDKYRHPRPPIMWNGYYDLQAYGYELFEITKQLNKMNIFTSNDPSDHRHDEIYVIGFGARVSDRAYRLKTARLNPRFSDTLYPLNSESYYQQILFESARNNKSHLIRYIHGLGHSINCRNHQGRNLLLITLHSNINPKMLIDMLLELGCDPNIIDNSGYCCKDHVWFNN